MNPSKNKPLNAAQLRRKPEATTQKKGAQEALRELEDRCRKIFENSIIGVYRTAPDGRILWANSAMQRMLGYSSLEELTQRNLEQDGFEPGYSRAEFKERIERDGEVIGLESAWTRRDGAPLFIHENCRAIRDVSGRIQYYDGSAEDITERKQAEEALRESEDRFRALFEQANDGMLLADVETKRFMLANRQIQRMLDYSEVELQQMTVADIHPAAELPAVLDQFEKLAHGKTTLTHGIPLGRKDGTVFYADVNSTVVRLQHCNCVLGVFRDITELKRAEKALKETERAKSELLSRLNEAQHIAKIGSWEWNLRANQVWWSDETYRIFGVTPQDYVPSFESSGEFIHRDDLTHYTKAFEHSRQTGEPLDFFVRLVARGGLMKRCHAKAELINDDSGQAFSFIGTVMDITNQKLAEEEKEELLSQLNQAQKIESVGRLAGGVAHGFNNMLGVILGHTELALSQLEPTQPLYDDLIEIRKAADRSADLTRQLLAFARKQTAAPKVLDLNQTITIMLNMLHKLIGENINLSWHPAENLWSVKIDPGQIDQILAKLFINARDALPGVGKITIGTENCTLDDDYCTATKEAVPGEYVLLSVSDDGCGMNKETLAHIYEPFFTTKDQGKGTGLGLATIYGIVKQNNGFIYAYSEPGQGATFKIYLPRHVDKTEQVAGTEGVAQPAKRGHETILLVEDEPGILKLTTRMLEMQGYTVLAASTPGKAMRLAKEHGGKIHLIMTDVVMPEMNGRDLAKNLRSFYPHIKQLFTSGYTADVIAHNGVLAEGVHFIQKPFALKSLTNKIREVLDKA